MTWPPSRERLLERLAQIERHISSIEQNIERQKRTIAQREAAGRGNSEAVETVRALLVTMQKAQALYVRDRERIKGWLAKQPE